MSKRRLIGPMILTLVICGLWSDYLYFADSRWSVVRIISKVAGTVGTIFGPTLNPGLYGWLKDLTVPALIAALAIALLSLLMARAKTAMSDATPNADALLPRAEPEPAPVPKTVIVLDRAPVFLPRKPHESGLLAKFIFSFGAVSVLFTMAVCVIVYQYTYGATNRNVQNRADIIALGMADISAQRLTAGNLGDLAMALARYEMDRAVAYVYIEDANGRIVAHTPNDLIRYLSRDFASSAEQAIHDAEVQYRGLAVFEIAKRIDGRKGGFVRLGIWRAAIDEETRLAIVPIAATIFAALLATIGIFVVVIRSVNRPFLQLVEHAERISKGDLAESLEFKRTDEIGEIAQSLERMRSSLHAALTRLDESQ